ncbi:sushi, von Willebrand factor type A, EGF and pentraxin domain-containing protein 1-like isoform X2 [Ostrea edulis]|nr:sushi, von Willebrand factor type A, EGF and pentraxin domain-containing protein 1-like isoform X2 [Ostrea edulis]
MVSTTTIEPNRIMCDKSSDNKPILDKVVPSCQAIICPVNVTELDPAHGSPVCTHNNHKYDSSCVTQCESGYSLTSGIIFSTCQKDKTWSTDLPDCQDSEDPQIMNCPNTIYAYTDRNSQTAVVNWVTPTATDNSGSPTVTQTRGPTPGSNFQLGLTEIRYRATDASSNTSPECIFFVNVEEIRCDPPLIVDKYLFYQCPDGYSYGATCQLQCMGSFPLIGNDTITCERNDSYAPPRGYWEMGESQPYCSKNPCDKLPAPENGAMVCDTWIFGLQCQMQCSSQYDIPFGTVSSNGAPFTGLFTCSESKGVYTPSNTVPGCTQLRRPGMTTVLGEFFYYTGDCNDPTVLDEIKQNFINQMQLLEAQGWNGVCPSQIDCNVNNTEVTCGPVNGKKKRDVLDVLRGKRSTHEIRVEVTMTTTWYNFNSTGGTTFYFLEDVQKKVYDVVKATAAAGNLTVRGLSPDISSFALGYSNPNCPDGTIIRWSTLTCVPCSAGTFLDTSDPMKPACKDCPVGTYKEIPEDLACIPCPTGTITEATGAMNITSCLKKCGPGEYSKTGLEPCHLCPKSFYQNDEMSTSCTPCPPGKTTTYSGATGSYNCSNFDVRITEAMQKISFDPPGTDQTTLCVSSWVSAPKAMANISIFYSESSSMIFGVFYKDSLIVYINSHSMSTGVILPTETWSHIALQLDSNSQIMSVFLNGIKVYSASVASAVPSGSSLITSTSSLSISLNEASISGYVLSGYQVEFSVLSDADITSISSMCHTTRQSAFISMKTFANMSQVQPSTTFLSPSICDNINQCDSNPCNGHLCIDKVNAFKCQCKNGYYGDTCQNPPDYCKDSPCKNGATCSNSGNNFTCSCPRGYKGNQCQIQIVDGGWSAWSSYSECSASCGVGVKSRSRQCNSPVPDPDGTPCDPAGTTETVSCNTDTCPSCPPLRRGFGSKANCTTYTDGHQVCIISCRSGYSFPPSNQPLPVYVCGPNTSYTWNGAPPACGRANSPSRISMVSYVTYSPDILCADATTAASKIKANLESSLPCSLNASCSVDVTTPGCSTSGRRRRSTLSQTITLTQTFTSGDNLNLEAFEDSGNVSQPLYDLLMGISALEASAVQINSSHSVLQFDINGVQYTSTAVTTSSDVECPSGQGRSEALCIDCPAGTYSQSGGCVLCTVGFYQDELGKSSCKSCPSGLTTKYQGSQDVLDCSENSTFLTTTSSAIASSAATSSNSTSTTSPVTPTLPTTVTSLSSTEDSSHESSKKEKDKDGVLLIACVIVAVAVLITILSIISILTFKHLKRIRFHRESSTMKGSWASLSMVKPQEVCRAPPTSHIYHGMPVKTKFHPLTVETF